MKTIELKLYKFDELANDVKNTVIENYTESLEYFDDGVIEDCTDLLEHLGFKNVEIEYSLDYSHVPYAKVLGNFSKKDLKFIKENYMNFNNVSLIVELIETLEYEQCQIDTDFYAIIVPNVKMTQIMELVNAMIFEMIESDNINYYSKESILDNLMNDDVDYLIDGKEFIA